MTPPRAALPSVTGPRQAAGLAPRSQNFLCRVHGVGFDAAAFCLRNSMCLSDVSSGVLQVEGDRHPESLNSPSATPVPSGTSLGEGCGLRKHDPGILPGAAQGCGECVLLVSVSRKGGVVCTPLHAGVGPGAAVTSAQAPRASLEETPSTPVAGRGSHTHRPCVGRHVPPGEAHLWVALCSRALKSTLSR